MSKTKQQSLTFSGFSKNSVRFLGDLQKNNSKLWFEEHRKTFDEFVMPEAQAFVSEMGRRLREIAPEINAIPKTDKSIFRIHRDVRFSPDKSPYKTHLGIFLWEGPGKKLENSGFYFQLNPKTIWLGTGLHIFPKHLLQAYRDAVVHPLFGPRLLEAVKMVSENPSFKLPEKQYKKTPRGYDTEHPNAEWLLYGGMSFMYQEEIPSEIHTAGFIDYCYEKFVEMAPIHFWLREMVQEVIA